MADPDFLTHKLSPHTVAQTVERFINLVSEKGLKLFAVIDHSGEASAHGLELRDTKVIIFGSPQAGTPVMVGAPLAALDLPLKILVWDDNGQTTVNYVSPVALQVRYGLSEELAAPLSGIDTLVDLAIA